MFFPIYPNSTTWKNDQHRRFFWPQTKTGEIHRLQSPSWVDPRDTDNHKVIVAGAKCGDQKKQSTYKNHKGHVCHVQALNPKTLEFVAKSVGRFVKIWHWFLWVEDWDRIQRIAWDGIQKPWGYSAYHMFSSRMCLSILCSNFNANV